MDHYFVLGITKDATLKDIEKAYRQLAKKHHPDKGGDENRFKEVSAAYEVLKDADLRQKYDNVLDSNILRYINLRFVSFSPRTILLSVTLAEVLAGAEKTFKENIPCFFDAGDRALPAKNAVFRCKFCYVTDDCATCLGTRWIISDKIYCRDQEREIKVEIVPRQGIFSGRKIDYGAYIILFQIEEEENVQLKKHDIILTIDIPIEKFILGETFEIDTFEKMAFCCGGKNLNNSYVYPGLGLYKSTMQRGDLIVVPRIVCSPALREIVEGLRDEKKYNGDASILYLN